MKTLRIPLTVLCALAISALSAHSAQLASAKVLQVEGSVAKYSLDGDNSPLKVGDILTEGESISVTALSSAKLVFSNGSEITVAENSSLNISKLEQASFNGSQSYEQLQADPSQSQTLLELNYGELQFHVKKLSQGSTFDIETPLGTAAIRGTTGMIKLFFNAAIGEFRLIVTNNDGLVDIISRYYGGMEYGRGNTANTRYASDASDESRELIPQQHTVVIRLNNEDPLFDALFQAYKNYIPADPKPGVIQLPAPVFTPEDPGVIIVSPEDGANL